MFAYRHCSSNLRRLHRFIHVNGQWFRGIGRVEAAAEALARPNNNVGNILGRPVSSPGGLDFCFDDPISGIERCRQCGPFF
jgi:hypothetical protein